MTDVYNICFYGGLILAILFLITSVTLFFVLKIPKVVGELTGRTARKSIEEMKGEKGSSDVSKKEQAKYYNQDTGKIKVRQSATERKKNNDDTTTVLGNKKGRTSELAAEELKRSLDEDSTDVLTSGEESPKPRAKAVSNDDDDTTDVLRADDSDNATDVLHADDSDSATDVLRDNKDDDKTDILTSDDYEEEGTTDVLTSDDYEEEGTTDVLTSDDYEEEGTTDVLRAEEDSTDVLRYSDSGDDATSILSAAWQEKIPENITIIYNAVVVHTDERL